jgi:EAL domain-containing protein (putative c-di-GMP-specific phosphodiesterase class I)
MEGSYEGLVALSRVLTKGVENEETARLLETMGCEKIQGYWLARPLQAEDIQDFIQ